MLHYFLSGWFPELSATVVILGTISVLMVVYLFFDLFISTVFYYLFNDVVPTAFMGRFLGFFRVIGSLAGALFNFFLFRYAESHTAHLFVAGALLYGMAFMLMTSNVKEGNYPPPEPVVRTSLLSWVRIFISQCLSHKIYRLIFAYSAILAFAGSTGMFGIFMAQSVGLTLGQYGQVIGAAGFVGMLLMYPMGAMVDRFHPLPVMLASKIGFCAVTSVQFVFLFWNFSPSTAFWIYAVATAIIVPANVATAAATFPMLMQIFPKGNFGQFCAANAMSVSVGGIVGGLAAGGFLDFMKRFFAPESTFYYRFVPVWQFLFMFLAIGMLLLVIREWKRLGGNAAYMPPDPLKRKVTTDFMDEHG